MMVVVTRHWYSWRQERRRTSGEHYADALRIARILGEETLELFHGPSVLPAPTMQPSHAAQRIEVGRVGGDERLVLAEGG